MSARLRGRLPWLAGGLIALLGLVLVAGLAVAAMRRPLDNGRVYTVGQVQAQLAHTPEAWVGRSVRVRGMVLSSGCLSWDPGGGGVQCRDRTTYLLDRDGASLPIAGWQRDPLLAFLQRLPLAGRLVPRALVVRWGEVATYRVRLLVAPAAACGAAPCHEALLLDAAPDALGAG